MAERTVEAELKLAEAKELCDDLRGYTHEWDWKYADRWAEEYRTAFGVPWDGPVYSRSGRER